jgi:hypothetical protein
MRRIFYIPAILMLYLLFTAKSCDEQAQAREERANAAIEKERDSIRSVLAADSLTEGMLRSFESLATARLADYAGYRAIAADTSADTTFRKKAEQMMKRMRAPGTDFADLPAGIIADSVTVKEPLHHMGKAMYTGKLAYWFMSGNSTGEGSTGRTLREGTTGFLVVKVPKMFGSDTLMVWEVYLLNPG